jgi:hypothetical protein
MMKNSATDRYSGLTKPRKYRGGGNDVLEGVGQRLYNLFNEA